MKDYIILYQVQVTDRHIPTGAVRHYRDGIEIVTPDGLRIVNYPDVPGYYLLYLDDKGEELTDTYHENLDRAFAQAEREYNVLPQDWSKLN